MPESRTTLSVVPDPLLVVSCDPRVMFNLVEWESILAFDFQQLQERSRVNDQTWGGCGKNNTHPLDKVFDLWGIVTGDPVLEANDPPLGRCIRSEQRGFSPHRFGTYPSDPRPRMVLSCDAKHEPGSPIMGVGSLTH